MGTLLSILLLLFLLPEVDLFSSDFLGTWAIITAVVFIGGIFSFKRNFIVMWLVMAATILVMMTLLFHPDEYRWALYLTTEFWIRGAYILFFVIFSDLFTRGFVGAMFPDYEGEGLQQVELVVSHDASQCPLVDWTASGHGLCWWVRAEDERFALGELTENPLSDQDVSSLLAAGEVFLDDRKYRLNITFEADPETRKGIVFWESKVIVRALGMKQVTPGAFLGLDSEQLQIV
jgi:hypothetical protein